MAEPRTWDWYKRVLEDAIELDRQARQTIRETERLLDGDSCAATSAGSQRANQSARLNSSRQPLAATTYNSLQSSSPDGANSNGGTVNTTSNASSTYKMSRSLSSRYPPRQNSRFTSTPLDPRPRNFKK